MQQANQLRAQGRAGDAATVEKVARLGVTSWLTGTVHDLSNLRMVLYGGGKEKGSTKIGQLPFIVLYNIPHRDCGSYSAGGLTAADYPKWIATVSEIIGSSQVAVILEPDAIHVTSCLSQAQRSERWSLLNAAVTTLTSRNPGAVVYLAAPAGTWNLAEHAAHLRASGVAHARGIALNIAGFEWTRDAVAAGESYRRALGMDLHYLIDTSMNGNGPHKDPGNKEAEWCNPPGRAYGTPSTTHTGNPRIDAFVWIASGSTNGDCWKSQHFDHAYDYILQVARNTWGEN